MFVYQNSLRHLLRPEHYCSVSHYDREIAELFRPTWQLVATKSELPGTGDFLTDDLFGRPILIRNCDGHYAAFENICSHRHCLLTHEPSGNSPSLRCQYHGWEYDNQGKTAKIPDARCFRPWDRDNSMLNTFRIESCGDLLFATLSESVPPLKEWLSPFFDETETAFSAPVWQQKHVWEYDASCNWKIPVENTLESYHLPELHKNSLFGFMPTEEDSEHMLSERWTALTYSGQGGSWLERLQGSVSQWLGRKPTLQYRHRHIHPNTILVSSDTINYAQTLIPTSPRTVRIKVRFFGVRGTRRGLLAGLISRIAWRIGRSRTLQVMSEDLSIYEAQQRGLEASHHPGVIGTREERIHVFQKYILESLSIALPDDPAEANANLAANS